MTNFDKPTVRRGTNCVKWDDDEQEGILPFWVADMDFEVAPAIQEAIMKRTKQGIFGYTHVPQEYYDAVTSWYERRHHLTINKEWILYTTGVVPGVSVCIKALTEPGDKVVVLTPVYNCFFSSIRNQGCETVESPLIYHNQKYYIDFVDFEKRCADPEVKVFLLCNPHNPACRVWTNEELERLNDICLRHHVKIISDEIHGELTFPGIEYNPIYRVSEACRDNSIMLCSSSKTFNTAGLQTANIICNDATLRERINKIINIYEVCDLNPFGMEALMAAYNGSEGWLDDLREYVYENYQALCRFFETELPDWKVTRSEGTYLAWIDIRATGMTSAELSQRLKERGHVRVCCGPIYGQRDGEGFIRINMATQRACLMEGLRRIKKAMQD